MFSCYKNETDQLLCVRRIVTWRLRFLMYTFSFLVRPHVEYWIQFCASCYKRDTDILQKCIYCERDQALTQFAQRGPPLRTQEQPSRGALAWAEDSLNFNNCLILWHWRCSALKLNYNYLLRVCLILLCAYSSLNCQKEE